MAIKSKKIFKIVTGVIIFFTLPSLILFGFLFFKYNEELPTGIQGEKADALAHKMLDALNYEAFKNTSIIEWTFKKRHHYSWDKEKNTCDVYWKDYKVILNLDNLSKSTVYIHSFKNESDMAPGLIDKAITYFNNDSFWLVAPYKVFDKGVERRLVKTENNEEALLVTYTSGGSTPGDSYLWLLDDKGKPIAFKIWASILPIDGLEASWSDWTTTESGAQLPTFHKLMVLGLEIDGIKGIK
ncbi:hypothetical protein SAMN05428642_102465 [Flaviramulus basaltis]|uniref:Uncharacterized protein n=1 Tax=Flaviramulus basaltis TaxID=369401 RepID=A0A1K2IIC3_9FLAO|nr:hypothetical protein [Flaviramulus basaltis]SFZ91984.1 hypothetical protein SAMN05428642_102465 [Flaviramulus basaltis]